MSVHESVIVFVEPAGQYDGHLIVGNRLEPETKLEPRPLLMPSLGQAVAALWLVLGTARAANYVVYDGGVRRQNDTTITNNTYAPGLGGRFAGGASGLVLTDVGAGWRVEAVGGVAAATPAVHRSVCAYGNGGDFASCSTR